MNRFNLIDQNCIIHVARLYILIWVAILMVINIGCGVQRITELSDECTDPQLLESYDYEIYEVAIEEGVDHRPILSNHSKSGDNFHAISEDENGGLHEFILIAGKPIGYKSPGEDWIETDPYIVTRNPFPRTMETRCPDVTEWTNAGSEVVDGTAVTRYTRESSKPGLVYWEYLLDADGKLIQAERTAPIGRGVKHYVRVKFSGFGEPNVVVDPFPQVTPVYTSTPGPSPTPDPSATATPTSTPTSTPAPTATATPTPDGTLDLEGSLPRAAAVVLPTPTPRAVVMAEILMPSPTPTPTPTAIPTPTSTPTATPSPTPAPNPLISRIEPSSGGVIVVNNGDTLRLSVAVYGRQNIRDDSLGDNVSFDWSSTSRSGTFREAVPSRDVDSIPDDRQILFTATRVGTTTVTASLDQWECVGGCSAEFTIRIRR